MRAGHFFPGCWPALMGENDRLQVLFCNGPDALEKFCGNTPPSGPISRYQKLPSPGHKKSGSDKQSAFRPAVELFPISLGPFFLPLCEPTALKIAIEPTPYKVPRPVWRVLDAERFQQCVIRLMEAFINQPSVQY